MLHLVEDRIFDNTVQPQVVWHVWVYLMQSGPNICRGRKDEKLRHCDKQNGKNRKYRLAVLKVVVQFENIAISSRWKLFTQKTCLVKSAVTLIPLKLYNSWKWSRKFALVLVGVKVRPLWRLLGNAERALPENELARGRFRRKGFHVNRFRKRSII